MTGSLLSFLPFNEKIGIRSQWELRGELIVLSPPRLSTRSPLWNCQSGSRSVTSSMVIRRYRRTDIVAVLELFHDTVHTINARDYTPDQLEAWAPAFPPRELWHKRLSIAETYVAEEHRSIVGFGSLTSDGWVDTLYTHKNFQGRGVASALLRKIVSEAVAAGIAVLRATSSTTARSFFELNDFTLDWEQEKAHYGRLFKSVVMKRILTD